MGFYGDLQTVSVEELLRWVEAGAKSGTLEVERDNIVKRLTFSKGRVVSCSSNDPATLMGQFLLSRGVITQELLGQALHLQEQCSRTLGEILKSMEAITETEITEFMDAKIEEAIYGLFDADDGVFRFETESITDPYAVSVDLPIHDVLERGLQRSEERKRFLKDRGIVLRHTDRTAPPWLSEDPVAKRILDLIDGNRTVADIRLQSHAPEFQVDRILTSLRENGILEIEMTRPTLAKPELPVDDPEFLQALEAVEGLKADADTALPAPEHEDAPKARATDPRPTKRRYRLLPSRPAKGPREFRAGLKLALQLLSIGRPGSALHLLDAMSSALPGDKSLTQLVATAEKDFCDAMLDGDLRPGAVPVRNGKPDPSGARGLSSEETYLLEQVDGKRDFKTIIWLAPMHDVVALKAFGRLLQRGSIAVSRVGDKTPAAGLEVR